MRHPWDPWVNIEQTAQVMINLEHSLVLIDRAEDAGNIVS